MMLNPLQVKQVNIRFQLSAMKVTVPVNTRKLVPQARERARHGLRSSAYNHSPSNNM